MPVTRLQPLPFPEPARVIAFIEEDPSIIEEGMRVIARKLPLPGAGPSVLLDLLAVDGQGRITAIQVGTRLTSREVAAAAAAHRWIAENTATLRGLCPPLAEAREGARILMIAGSVDPALAPLLDGMAPPTLEVYRGTLFRSPGGPALSLQAMGRAAAPRPAPPASVGPAAAPAGISPAAPADPLAGIPISPAELAEFRKLVSPSWSRTALSRRKGGAVQPALVSGASPLAVVEN